MELEVVGEGKSWEMFGEGKVDPETSKISGNRHPSPLFSGIWGKSVDFIRKLEIPDVLLIDLDMKHDDRGFLVEAWRDSWFTGLVPEARFVQTNHSFSFARVQRGLHYQLNPKAMGKLVHVVLGEIYDVAVDIRKGSPWYGRHIGVILDSGQSLYIPPGFAHGFYAYTNSHVVYHCTEAYDPNLDRAIYWDRKRWPIEGSGGREAIAITTSEKDRNAPRLEEVETGFVYGGGA